MGGKNSSTTSQKKIEARNLLLLQFWHVTGNYRMAICQRIICEISHFQIGDILHFQKGIAESENIEMSMIKHFIQLTVKCQLMPRILLHQILFY